MKVKVLFFAALRERMQTGEMAVELEEADSVAAVAARLTGLQSGVAYAVNDEMVSADYRLHDGDTLALIPPMAGG